ncbi:HTTM domain-containing protein [Microbacterium gorillae]|uniref:HTTM domain-containing protein n=1 Tax=Microbacterium gorillae TaxID=1231063 RepID=UPI000AE5CA15|nr:HTTM domain-containing protein [Microbacterium gorillae]
MRLSRVGAVGGVLTRTVRALAIAAGTGFQDLLVDAGRLILRTGAWVEAWLLDSKKAEYGLAVTRILFGVAAVGLLVSNFRTRLYSFGSGSLWNGEGVAAKSDFPQFWLFSAFHRAMANDVVYTVLYVLLLALAVAFLLGWRTRAVHPVFFVMWVSFIEANDMLGDQGDNMFRIALFFMMFADCGGRLSLDARRRTRRGTVRRTTSAWYQAETLAHNLVLVILTAQVSFVYVSGALYKASGSPWSGGYAVYNPLSTDRFGTWPALSELVTAWGPAVTIASWGSIIMQLSFPFLLLSRPTRILGLGGILSFHVAIAVLMGLPWFSLGMIAIDSIFIRDRTWRTMGTGLRRRLQAARQTVPPPASPGTSDEARDRGPREARELAGAHRA